LEIVLLYNASELCVSIPKKKLCVSGYVTISYSFLLFPSFVFAAKTPFYFYAFLKCTNSGNAFESLRRTSLGILGSLVKVINTWIGTLASNANWMCFTKHAVQSSIKIHVCISQLL
jgi:hypothetical protein